MPWGTRAVVHLRQPSDRQGLPTWRVWHRLAAGGNPWTDRSSPFRPPRNSRREPWWESGGWSPGPAGASTERCTEPCGVEREDESLANSVALKMGLLPEEPHFEREVELLSRTRNPSIPRLWDSGEWRHASGAVHPFIIMDWVDGVPLYEWARQHDPSSQQVFRWLGQLAGALAAVHSQRCVHRDVKGENVLVRRADGRAMLTDFGSSRHPEATLLTPQMLVPGTPAYQPPEAALFPLRFGRDATARYQAGPADDVYSLGVLAYRLVTGQYPELGEPFKDATGFWQPGELGSPAPHVLKPRLEPRLSAGILRMLSAHPEQRGTAAEWSREWEELARQPVPASPQPLAEREAPVRVEGEQAAVPSSPPRSAPVPAGPRAPSREERPWLGALAVAVAVGVATGWAAWCTSEEASTVARHEVAGSDSEDAGTSGLGETTSLMSREDTSALSPREGLAEEPLPDPVPEQTRPMRKGDVPRKSAGRAQRSVLASGSVGQRRMRGTRRQMFKGRCYMPIFPAGRRPTSSPPHQQP